MLSKKQQKALCEIFKTLPALDKKLIALRIICCHYLNRYGFEKTFIQEIIKSGISDVKGRLLTHSVYQARIKQLIQLKFAQNNKSGFIICKELHHAILPLMSTEDMRWVFAMVDVLYANKAIDFKELQTSSGYHYEDKDQIRAHLLKAIYSNKPHYFMAHHNNPNYFNKLADYVENIFDKSPINMEWLQSRNKLIQAFICIALLKSYYCEKKSNFNDGEILNLFTKLDLHDIEHDTLHYHSAIIYLSLGHTEKAATHCRHIKVPNSGFSLALQATIAFLTNQTGLASTLFRKALPSLRKQYDNRFYYFDNILGVFHNMCLAYVDKQLPQLSTNAQHFNRYSM